MTVFTVRLAFFGNFVSCFWLYALAFFEKINQATLV